MNNSDSPLTHPALTPSVTPCASPQNGQMQNTKRKICIWISQFLQVFIVLDLKKKSWRNIYVLDLKLFRH